MLGDSESQSQPGGRRGVYGFAIEGLDDPGGLVPADPRWPCLRVVRAAPNSVVPGGEAGAFHLDDQRAELWITKSDRIEVDRRTLTARFSTRERLSDDAILHPYLGLPASLASRWLGRQVFHGGAFALAGRAWALLGDKESGKSSTLAWFLRAGHQAVTDDVLILEGRQLFSGPRCVDLRPDAGERLGGEPLGMLGNRVRTRLRAGPAPPSAPLGGLVQLEWGESVRIEPLDPGDRLQALVRNSNLPPAREESAAFLELAALPGWRFVRPRDLDGMERANAQLLERLESVP